MTNLAWWSSWVKIDNLINGADSITYSYGKDGIISTSCVKLNFSWIVDLNVKFKNIFKNITETYLDEAEVE